MSNTHGGRRDNTKRRPDDKRGGQRIPGPGKKLGRPKTMKTFRYEPIALDDLTANDLKEEAVPYNIGNAYAVRITIYDATGTRAAPETAQALYIDGRLGIAWGADATWADAKDVESGIEMWLNDGEAWEAAN